VGQQQFLAVLATAEHQLQWGVLQAIVITSKHSADTVLAPYMLITAKFTCTELLARCRAAPQCHQQTRSTVQTKSTV